MRIYGAEVDKVARPFGVRIEYFDATRPDEVPAALGRIAAARPNALLVAYDPVLDTRAREISYKIPAAALLLRADREIE